MRACIPNVRLPFSPVNGDTSVHTLYCSNGTSEEDKNAIAEAVAARVTLTADDQYPKRDTQQLIVFPTPILFLSACTRWLGTIMCAHCYAQTRLHQHHVHRYKPLCPLTSSSTQVRHEYCSASGQRYPRARHAHAPASTVGTSQAPSLPLYRSCSPSFSASLIMTAPTLSLLVTLRYFCTPTVGTLMARSQSNSFLESSSAILLPY